MALRILETLRKSHDIKVESFLILHECAVFLWSKLFSDSQRGPSCMSQDRVGNTVVTNNPKISVDDDTSDFSVSPYLESISCPYSPSLISRRPLTSEQTKPQKTNINPIVLLDYPLCGRHMKNQLFYKVLFHLIL